jgi:hypothetical protein
MQHALHLPHPGRTILIPLAAAVLGAGAATTTYALIDNNDVIAPPVAAVQPDDLPSTGAGTPQPFGGHRAGVGADTSPTGGSTPAPVGGARP